MIDMRLTLGCPIADFRPMSLDAMNGADVTR